jgi:hypothetical protein
MSRLALTFSSQRSHCRERCALEQAIKEVRDIGEVAILEELEPALEESMIEIYIHDAEGPFPDDLFERLMGAIRRTREGFSAKQQPRLFLRLSGTGPRFELPADERAAEIAFMSEYAR